ncbi:MAG TPA: MFS transporter [Terriglobia bacterium]|nr:MFS transporter [Terriglobia bacterium]
MKTIEVGALLDEGRWTGYQKLLILGTALTIILDGVDNQLMGPTIPTLMKEWGLPREAFTHVLTAGPLGMMFGGLFGGLFGDKVGRRTALLSSVIVFAAITLGISFVGDPNTLTVLRFLAGLGLGGAMPNAAVLASEYVPRNRRALAVTVTIVCVPLGGYLAARSAALIIPVWGWERLWQLGGILPIVLGIVLFKILPESPKYLASHPERWPELRHVLTKIGHDIPADAKFVPGRVPAVATQPKGSYAEVFARHRLRDTIGLAFAFFFCLMGNYLCIQWMPTMLTSPEVGFELSAANTLLSAFNFGGVGGALMAGVVILHFGSRSSMLFLTALSIVGAVILSTMRLEPSNTWPLYLMILFTGGLMNAVQTTMYALAAHVYPTEIRGRGVGTAVAVGRIGHSLTGQLGPWAMGSGSQHYFLTWAYSMGVVFLALALVKRHIEKNTVKAPGGH